MISVLKNLMGIPRIHARLKTLSQALSRALSTKFTTKLATKVIGPRESWRRAGFSLVEILVATTILLIIVMMISMVFQQTSGAYQSGTRRVKSQTVLRSVLGTISRDLTLAVDSRNYPGIDNDFSSSAISFIALTGIPDKDTPGKRAPQWIEYKYDGASAVKRRCADLTCREQNDGTLTWSQVASGQQETTLNPSQPLTTFFFEITPDMSTPGSMLPLRVDIQGAIETDGKSSFVSGRSAGKDRKWKTADDIVVGGE